MSLNTIVKCPVMKKNIPFFHTYQLSGDDSGAISSMTVTLAASDDPVGDRGSAPCGVAKASSGSAGWRPLALCTGASSPGDSTTTLSPAVFRLAPV